MAQEKSEAIVLRGVDYSETSRILTLLTPHRGKISCLARGLRRKNSPLASSLDLYNRVELVYAWKDGRGIQNLIEATLLDAWLPMKRDLESGAYASLILELAMKMVHENEPSEEFFAMVLRGFETLNEPVGDARPRCCWVVMRLLGIAGYSPQLDGGLHCSEVTQRSGAPVQRDGYSCCRCHGGAMIARQDLERLRAFAASAAYPAGPVSPGVLPVLAQFASCQLETELRSMRVIEKVLA